MLKSEKTDLKGIDDDNGIKSWRLMKMMSFLSQSSEYQSLISRGLQVKVKL